MAAVSSGTAVVERAYCGRALVATCNYAAGQVVLEEQPLLLINQSRQECSHCVALEECSGLDANMWANYFACDQLKPPTLEQVMSLCAPLHSCKAEKWRKQAKKSEREIHTLLPSFDLDRFLLINLIFSFNGFDCQAFVAPVDGLASPCAEERAVASKSSGLFITSCMMSHSCSPNVSCHWQVRADRPRCEVMQGVLVVRAIRDIKVGDELLHSYMGSAFMLMPAAERQRRLQMAYEFQCGCQRCEAAHDDMLIFHCLNSHCSGSFCMSSDRKRAATRCSKCGVDVPDEQAQQMARKDMELAAELRSMPAPFGARASRRVLSLSPLHPQHHLTHGIAQLQFGVHADSGNVEGMLASARLAEESLASLVASPCNLLAVSLERIGGLLLQLAAGRGPASAERCRESRHFFGEALRVVQISQGQDSPRAGQLAKKLAQSIETLSDSAEIPCRRKRRRSSDTLRLSPV
eukprot:TRINITY_DN59426_c0_g1_i1.p1 TRINITY_DN59426_c0_g1~~TRINITY_DN59426_c0_g1_i1.p1  ORF type:complete len:464 (+),score=53.65 TRINITY_DN59426_c0_g1_i1:287-1678(+)